MNFDYIYKQDDDSYNIVETDEKFYNYDRTILHRFDKTYEELYHVLLDDDEIAFNYIYPKNNFDKKYVLRSINVWKSLGINLHNLNIFKLFRTGNMIVISSRGLLGSYTNKDCRKLKLDFQDIPQWESKLILKEIDEEDFKSLVFNKIILPKVEKKLASTIYAHEMTHAQMMVYEGGTNSIFNEETLPILMELIFADELDPSINTLKLVNNERLISICKFIDILSRGNDVKYSDRVTSEKYIVSSLQAIELFKIYSLSTTRGKKEMLEDVNNIINGFNIVEDMLDKYQIDYEYTAKRKSLKLY